MVQPQLADYIKTQLKTGVDKDSVKSALVTAGWPAQDIDDSMASASPVSSVNSAPAGGVAPSASPVSPFATMKSDSSAGGPIKVSDLFNTSKMATTPAAKEEKKFDISKVMPAKNVDDMPKVMSKSWFSIHNLEIVFLAVVSLVSVSGVIYLYTQGSKSQVQFSAIQDELTAANSNVATLNTKVTDLTQQLDAAKTNADELTVKNAELSTELSFVAVATGVAPADNVQFSTKGVLSGGGKVQYSLLTPGGVKIMVKNYKDAAVDAVLKPLVGQTIDISGTHALGSKDVTVTTVNAAAITAPAPAETATSTAPAA